MFASVNGCVISDCSGPASQPGNTTRLRGTRTVGPEAATATITNVATISAPSAIRPGIGPTLTRGIGSERRPKKDLTEGSATVPSVGPAPAPATGGEANEAVASASLCGGRME